MYRNYILLGIFCLFSIMGSGQTLEQARTFFKNGDYEKALPVFQKYVKSSPNNANYNYWYGACCYETGQLQEAEKYLKKSAARKVPDAFRYLGQLYFDLYHFDESVENYGTYIEMLKKKKQPVTAYEKAFQKAKLAARMLKGVEEVTVIDSFVVDKNDFLAAYKISEESGKIMTYNEYFNTTGNHPGTVYETELGNKLYYGERKNNQLAIYSKVKLMNEWSKPSLLPDINQEGNQNYPYMLSDGVTLYYGSDGEGSVGGYDIFVTRYNSESDSYLVPDNIGMPFNSPYNDYLYLIDEYNNLGWFASDRFQPEGKVCVYVFIPNTSKQIYNFENTDINLIRNAAMIRSLKGTWKNENEVRDAKQRLAMILYQKPEEKKQQDFVFVINDATLYYTLDNFTSPKAKTLFKQWQQKKSDYKGLKKLLDSKRELYSKSNKSQKKTMAPELLDLEKRTEQMENELEQSEITIRNEENKYLKR